MISLVMEIRSINIVCIFSCRISVLRIFFVLFELEFNLFISLGFYYFYKIGKVEGERGEIGGEGG